jgi:multiple sugar transport system permease protein
MFPRAIQQASKPKQVAYSLFLPIALFIWILPLLAVFLTSVRGAKDINTGNVFGWPSEFKFVENYTAVFMQTEAVKYFFNSFLITLPAVAISIALACLAGYALAIYRFRLALPLFFLIIRLPANSFFTRRSKLGFALCSCAILLRHCLLI